MNPQKTYSLLIALAIALFVTSIVVFAVGGSTAIGASNVAIGCSLLAIAASQRKKSDDNG